MVTCIDIPGFPPLAWSANQYTIYCTKYGANFPPWRNWAIDTVTTAGFSGICSVEGPDFDPSVYVYAVGGNGSLWKNIVGGSDQPITSISSCELLTDVHLIGVTRGAITIEIESDTEVTAEVHIYDVTGRLKSTTDLGGIPEGSSIYTINHGQGSGSLLPMGVYYCVLDTGRERISTSFVLID